MHVISLNSYFEILLSDANFIFIGIIKRNNILVKYVIENRVKKYKPYNMG